MWPCVHARVHVWRTGDNPWEFVLSFHYKGCRDGSQVVRLVGKCFTCWGALYALICWFWHWLTSPFKTLFSGQLKKKKIPSISRNLFVTQPSSEHEWRKNTMFFAFQTTQFTKKTPSQLKPGISNSVVPACVSSGVLFACSLWPQRISLLGNEQSHFWLPVGLVM